MDIALPRVVSLQPLDDNGVEGPCLLAQRDCQGSSGLQGLVAQLPALTEHFICKTISAVRIMRTVIPQPPRTSVTAEMSGLHCLDMDHRGFCCMTHQAFSWYLRK